MGTGLPRGGHVSSTVVRVYTQPVRDLLWGGLGLGNPAFGTNPASTLFLGQHSLIRPFPHSLHPSSIPTLLGARGTAGQPVPTVFQCSGKRTEWTRALNASLLGLYSSLKPSVTVVRWTSKDKHWELAGGFGSRRDPLCGHVLGQVTPCGSRGPVWGLPVLGIHRCLQASSAHGLEPAFLAPRCPLSLLWVISCLF